MASRHRRDRSGFDLQPDEVSSNGKRALGPEQSQGSERKGKPPQRSAADDLPASSQGAESGGLKVAQSSQLGKIEVSPRAIAHLASRAAQRSYGVVGLAPRHSRPGLAELLRLEEAYKGVDVKFPESRVLIELYVVIEYGVRISEVARNIMSNVKFAVESALDVSVVQVNVNVQDIRVSDE